MDFYTAWNFLANHKMFNHWFEEKLWFDVVKVNPDTNMIDDDPNKNTKVQIWLEHGAWEEEIEDCCHDIDLDCAGNTFEEAIIELARLVKKYYTDDGKKRGT